MMRNSVAEGIVVGFSRGAPTGNGAATPRATRGSTSAAWMGLRSGPSMYVTVHFQRVSTVSGASSATRDSRPVLLISFWKR